MKKVAMLLIVFFCFVGFSKETPTKHYLQYHRTFSAIETLIVAEQFQEAEIKLDSLFGLYPVKFAKDYVVAAEVSLLNGHKEKAIQYIFNAIKMGIKLPCLQSIPLFKARILESDWTNIQKEVGQIRKDYLKNIQLDLYQEFHTRYQEEQDAKRTDQYKQTVYSNFNRIKSILEKGAFPGESMIGIDNQTLAPSIDDCDFGNSKAIVTLLHYDYPISELGIDQLIIEIENGNLHPRAFATIYNFEKNKISVLYKTSTKKYDNLPEYKFNFPFGVHSNDLETVNADRYKFGICKDEVDAKKDEISRKYGVKLRFGY
jgi:hypothetical protein